MSGQKNRFKQEDFDLDLTYITPRIIAMSYPASGLESIYRNPITEVSRFLKNKHNNNFLIINLSNRKYDYSKFDNMVKSDIKGDGVRVGRPPLPFVGAAIPDLRHNAQIPLARREERGGGALPGGERADGHRHLLLPDLLGPLPDRHRRPQLLRPSKVASIILDSQSRASESPSPARSDTSSTSTKCSPTQTSTPVPKYSNASKPPLFPLSTHSSLANLT